MFLRIFRYRVKPQMRDRHLALQARAARLYEQYVRHAPKYFRRSGDPNSWVELHWYDDKAECQRVAAMVADDAELARLWREFQETLDPDFPPSLDEFGEYELPRPVNASPFSQPPIDAAEPSINAAEPSINAAEPTPPPVAQPVADAPAPREPPASADVVAQSPAAPQESHVDCAERPADVEASEPKSMTDQATEPPLDVAAMHSSSNGEARRHDAAARESAAEHAAHADDDAAPSPSEDDGPSEDEAEWRRTPPAAVDSPEDLLVEDDAPSEPSQGGSLSYNDGVWIVEPEDRPRYPRGDEN